MTTYKEGDAVDVYQIDEFGWCDGVVEHIDQDRGEYVVRLDCMRIVSRQGRHRLTRRMRLPLLPSYHLVPSRTYCRNDWRAYPVLHMFLEHLVCENACNPIVRMRCRHSKRWELCELVHITTEKFLVVSEPHRATWYAPSSPLLRHLWDWE